MHSLRAKLLTSFCLAEVLILAAIVGVVTGQLRRDTSAQKSFVAENMEERAREGLRDHLRLLGLLLEEDQWSCVRAVELVTLSSDAIAAVEAFDIKYLQSTMETASASAGLDLFILYDIDGTALATFPPTIDDLASTGYFATWGLAQRVWGADTLAGDTWVGAALLPPEFLEAHGLLELAGPNATLGHVVLQVAADDFGDTVAIALGVKVLNGYHVPFDRAHRISDRGAALYAGSAPVAWAGFDTNKADGTPGTPPTLSPQVVGGIPSDGEFLDVDLSSAGGPLLATTVPLRDLEGSQVGILVATMPEDRVRDAAINLGMSSDAMLRSIRTGVLLVGAGALAVFFCTALFIESRLISRPLKPVSEQTLQPRPVTGTTVRAGNVLPRSTSVRRIASNVARIAAASCNTATERARGSSKIFLRSSTQWSPSTRSPVTTVRTARRTSSRWCPMRCPRRRLAIR